MLLILPQWFCSEEMPPSSTALAQQQLGAFDTSVGSDIAAKHVQNWHAPRAECQKPQEPDYGLRRVHTYTSAQDQVGRRRPQMLCGGRS